MAIFLIPAAFTLGELVVATAMGIVTGYMAKTAYDHRNERDKKSEQRGEDIGREKAEAEYSINIDRLEEAFRKRHAEEKRYFDMVCSLVIFGYTYAAKRNGTVSDECRDIIHSFVVGESASRLPKRIIATLDKEHLIPTLDILDVYELVKKMAPNAIEQCNELMELLDEHLDGPPPSSAMDFKTTWDYLTWTNHKGNYYGKYSH